MGKYFNSLNYFRRIIPFTLLIFIYYISCGQDAPGTNNDAIWVQKDLPQVIREALQKPPKIKPDESGSLLLIPVVASNPATGFMLGVAGQYAMKLPGSTLYSVVSGSTQFTSKGQKLFLLKNNIYTKGNKMFISGDWRFLIFSQPTYGLGTDSPEGGILDYQFGLVGIETSLDSLSQPMQFNLAKLYQSVSFEIWENIYLGVGYNFDSFTKIKDEKLSLTPGDTLLTSHYVYNSYYGFNTSKYFSSALNLSLVYDTRDNMINPYKGMFATISWRGGLKILGNKSNTNYYQFEYRSYHPFSKTRPRHLLAFWVMGNFASNGEFPYLMLPATAYDQRGRSGRGYTQGRFRGNNFLYGETEYRFPITREGGVLGGVIFFNATTTDNPVTTEKLFDSIKPGYGFGFRIMADKRSRTNLAIDIGFGQKSGGFYLSASETF